MTLRTLALLTLALGPLAALAQQTLVVDDAHSQMGLPKGATAPHYELAAGAQLLVDASAYTFKATGPAANAVQLILGPDRQYGVAWDPAHPSVVISSLSAHPYGNSQPFERFEAGQKLIVAIGHLEGAKFDVMWVGLADVR